jgi:hypothetical protein
MKKQMLGVLLLSSSALHAESAQNEDVIANSENTTFSHLVEYGFIDLDVIGISNNHERYLSLLNYRYYYTPVKNDDTPYEFQAIKQRASFVETNVIANDFSVYNISGRHYFNDNWDIDYHYFVHRETDTIDWRFWDYSEHYKRTRLDQYIKVIGSYQLTPVHQIGIGFRQDSTRDRYTSFDSVTRNNTFESNDLVLARYKGNYLQEDGTGWVSSFEIGKRTEQDYWTSYARLEYFDSKHSSFVYRFSYLTKSTKYYSEARQVFGFSHKYWFSEHSSIDYGVAYGLLREEKYDYTSSPESYFLFDLNGTYRF